MLTIKVLNLVLKGRSNREICFDLKINEFTTRKEILRLYRLYEVKKRSHLIVKALGR